MLRAQRGEKEKIKIIARGEKERRGRFFDGEVVRSGPVVLPMLCLSFAFALPILKVFDIRGVYAYSNITKFRPLGGNKVIYFFRYFHLTLNGFLPILT